METLRSFIFKLFIICLLLLNLEASLERDTKRRIQKFIKLQSIKMNLLTRLELKDRPALLNGNQKPSKSVLNALDKPNVTTTPNPIERERYFAEIQDIISLSEPAENFTDDNIFQFKIMKDSQGRTLEVQSANLLVKLKYKLKRKNKRKRYRKRRSRKIRLELRSVSNDGEKKDIISSLNATVYKTNWFKLAIPKSLIEEKLDSQDQTLRLYIKCIGCKKGAELVLVHGSKRRRRRGNRWGKMKLSKKRRRRRGHKRNKKMRKINRRRKRRKTKLSRTRPFLLLHTKVKTYYRPKREAENTCALSDGCCKSPFKFRFSDVGWEDWVISPPSFTTAFCGGSCVPTGLPSITNLTPNCTGTQYEALRIIYYDQSGSIIISRIPNMIVTECGCPR